MTKIDYAAIGTETDLHRARLYQRARAIGLIRKLWAKRREYWGLYYQKCYLMDSPHLSEESKAELLKCFEFFVDQALEADASIRDMISLVRETDAELYGATGSKPEH